MCAVPTNLAPAVRSRLLNKKNAIEATIDSLNVVAQSINARCRGITDPTAIAQCRRDAESFGLAARDMEVRKLNFNEDVRAAIRGGLRISEPPPAAEVLRERTRFRDSPREWLRQREEAVRTAVLRNAAWTATVLQRLNAPAESQRRFEITRLADLSAGDVILVAPPNEQLDPTGNLASEAIREGDWRYRAISEFARGRLGAAARQEREPPSHALTFLGNISGVRMYLSQDLGGPRIIAEALFLREFGAREMYVARVQAVVDGRRLWSAARNTAIRGPRNYGCVGEGKFVCSETAGIVVARATGLNMDTDRFGPIDVTPGDFFDKQGNVGKHFVITRLRLTPVPAN